MANYKSTLIIDTATYTLPAPVIGAVSHCLPRLDTDTGMARYGDLGVKERTASIVIY